MNLNTFEEVKNHSLTEELNRNSDVNEKMTNLQNELENYLQNNKEPNRGERIKFPIDITNHHHLSGLKQQIFSLAVLDARIVK